MRAPAMFIDHNSLARGGVALLLCAALLGCRPAELDATYGKRRGTPGAESVNGTSVLAAMFEDAGHRVTGWRRLSPKLEEADVIVWAPDRFQPPELEVRNWLENWLSNRQGRTLVYIGRDYDASIEYWKQMRRVAPPGQQLEVARRAAVAQSLFDQRRAALSPSENCDWFRQESELPYRQPQTLAGPWSAGIDASKTDLDLHSRIHAPSEKSLEEWGERIWGAEDNNPQAQRLLYAAEDSLVLRLTVPAWGGSQILVAANGSFLLNLPLVNHEHRKIAGKLIAACGPAGRVVFLESDEGGVEIFDTEPGANAPTGFEVFTVWPLGVILIHLTALGILACFTLFPIFGRPRELPPVTTADFGQHVTALGDMLERTGDREYAVSRLRQYHEQTKHEPAGKRRSPR